MALDDLLPQLDAGGVALFSLDLTSGRISWSGDPARLFGAEGALTTLEALNQLLPSADRATLSAALSPRSDTRLSFEIVFYSENVDRWMLLRGKSTQSARGKVDGALGAVFDITAQSSLTTAEAILRAGDAGLWMLDISSGELIADNRARALLQLPGSVNDAKALLENIHPDDRAGYLAAVDHALSPQGEGQYDVEYRISAASNTTEIWVESRGQLKTTAGRSKRLIGSVRDVSPRKRAEELLAESKERLESRVTERTRQLEAIVNSAVNAILTINDAGAIQTANRAAVVLFGYSLDELIGQNVRLLMPERYAVEHDQYIKNYIDTGHRKIIGIGREVTGKRKDGSTFPLHLAVSEYEDNGKRYFTGIITDLTDRDTAEKALRDSQARLAQSQKMDAIGQLTGGVAHDFNNLLTVITGNLELLDMRLEDEAARDLAHRADEAARMGARLTERLLTFSRRRKLQSSVINLNEVALSMLELLRRSLGETIAVNANLAPDLWNTKLDSSEIENAILNLAINSRDAMPNGGRILVETNNLRLTKTDAADFGELAPGEYVKLSVSDTGHGMEPKVLSRAFEPFFTTKETGRGTGLGLSTIYGFARQSGGDVRIYSEVGRGTTVSLYLPREISATDTKPAATKSIDAPAAAELVLVVEDNAQVRDLTVRRLAALGYETLVAENGSDAIDLLLRSPNVDLVFSDVVMPGGMSGVDIANWVSEHRLATKVLLTSGFAPEIVGAEDSLAAETPLLRKPYTQADLARAIRTALRGGES